MSDALLDREVGRYRITRVIGEGGMGRVYEAAQAESGAVVAIKVLAERYAADVSLIERFFAEARAANVIAHENIVKVHDLAQLPDGRPYIVMERLTGKTLRAVLDEEPPPLGGILHVVLEVLSALETAHAAGIIHRDLKPDNIFVTAKGRAKVLDFGIAKLTGANAVARTQTGVVLGTPEYMAPEQITHGSTDSRSDLYAVGVLLFEALAGRRPFVATSDFELMSAHVEQAPPHVRSLRPELPEALDAIVDRALAKRPNDRFSSARSMAAALRHVSSKIPVEEWRPVVPGGRLASPKPPSLPAPLEPSDGHRPPTLVTIAEGPRALARTKPSRSRAWIAIAGALAAAGVAGGAVAIRARDDQVGAGRAGARAGDDRAEDDRASDHRTAAHRAAPAAGPLIAATELDASSAADLPPPSSPPSSGPRVPGGTTQASRRVAGDAGVDATLVEPDPPAVPIQPANFDWRGYLPAARSTARARAADARLVGIELSGVFPDGHMSLDGGALAIYVFGSMTLPAETCLIRVTIAKRGASIAQGSGLCHGSVATPRCTSRQVREKARTLQSATSRRTAKLVFGARGWDLDAGGDLVLIEQIADDCEPGSWTASASTEPVERDAVGRALTADEARTFDVQTSLTAAKLLARELDLGVMLIGIAIDWRKSSYELRYMFIAKRDCIVVRVTRTRADAARGARCSGQKGRINEPTCSAAQVAAKAKVDGTYEWTGSVWLVYQRNHAKAIAVEDDC